MTANAVAATLSTSYGDDQATVSSISSLAKAIKEADNKVVGKSDYLPDILGRIGHAIYVAEQRQIKNIQSYTIPDVDYVYADVKDSLGNIRAAMMDDEAPVVTVVDGHILLPSDDDLFGVSGTDHMEPFGLSVRSDSDVPDLPTEVPDLPHVPDVPDVPVDDAMIHTNPTEIVPPSDDVMTKKQRSETLTIKQGRKLVYDPQMTPGETRLVTGSPGQMVKTYEDTYYNGELSYSTVIREITAIEPVVDILYIGSKVTDTSAPVVDLKPGDQLTHYVISELDGDIKGFVNKSYHDLLSESEDSRFAKASSQIDASYKVTDKTERPPFNQTYMWLGANDDVVTMFNATNFIDKDKVNEYLVHYINMDREHKGYKKLVYDKTLAPLTETRAQEMADYGHIRYRGRPHTRPDGTPWTTVLDQLPTTYKSYGFGENMLAYSVLSNPYQLVSEQWIAKRLFEQWKSSPLHYAAMMNPEYTRTAVSVKLTTRTNAKSENGTNWMIGAELFS